MGVESGLSSEDSSSSSDFFSDGAAACMCLRREVAALDTCNASLEDAHGRDGHWGHCVPVRH